MALPTSSPNGGAVYWLGADGNIYTKGAYGETGVHNEGIASSPGLMPGSYMTAKGNSGQATEIQDPNAPNSNPTGGVDPYAQYGGAAAYNNTVGGYNQTIGQTQSAIDRLGGQLADNDKTIGDSYTNAINQLLLGKNRTEQTYNTSKNDTSSDYVTSKNTIGTNAGNSLNGLLRLLGSRGAGGSSAYNQVAPGAVARDATLQRNDVSNTFAHNNQALDTNWGNYLTDYNNSVNSAGTQRDTQLHDAQNQSDQTRAGLLQQLGTAHSQLAAYTGGNAVGASQGYLDSANNLLNHLSSYSPQAISYDTKAYVAPDLAKYTFNSATPTVNGQAPKNDYTSPYVAALLDPNKKQQAAA